MAWAFSMKLSEGFHQTAGKRPDHRPGAGQLLAAGVGDEELAAGHGLRHLDRYRSRGRLRGRHLVFLGEAASLIRITAAVLISLRAVQLRIAARTDSSTALQRSSNEGLRQKALLPLRRQRCVARGPRGSISQDASTPSR